MTEHHYDAIIVGSGAGGAATAFNLVRAGKRLLVLERGNRLPRDGSTLDVKQVFKEGRFKNHDLWVDNHNRVFIPDEHYNVGGKTKTQESGTGATRQSRWLRTADGFAV